MLLSEVDKPGSDVEEYVSSLDAILVHKMELISVVRQRLLTFHKHLKTEEGLSKLFQQQNAGMMEQDEDLTNTADIENDEMMVDANGFH